MTKKNNLFDILNISALTVLALITIFPMYNVIVTSLTTEGSYLRNPAMLYPVELQFDSYRYVLSNKHIIRSFMNSLGIVTFGTFYTMILTITFAYALTKKRIKGIPFLFKVVLFTMFFNGGLIPFYILVSRWLGLSDSYLAMILPIGINTFYMIILMNSFWGIPTSLEESAKIDGANDIVTLFRIVVPTSLPTIICIMLFSIVDRWNEWYMALLFIRSQGRFPMTYLLRTIVSDLSTNIGSIGSEQLRKLSTVYSAGIQRAAIVFTMLPIMVIYPFMQKYFAKGIMIGAIKG